MKITGNEPADAFTAPALWNQFDYINTGLTIRQHFAAMALQGCIASCAGMTEWIPKEEISKRALEYADALIKQINETPNPNEE